MKSADQIVAVYQELADWHERTGQAQLRDRFLVLAADAALGAGREAEAERMRLHLLQRNPHHLLKPFASFAEAMNSPDVRNYVAGQRAKYPPPSAELFLASLKAQEQEDHLETSADAREPAPPPEAPAPEPARAPPPEPSRPPKKDKPAPRPAAVPAPARSEEPRRPAPPEVPLRPTSLSHLPIVDMELDESQQDDFARTLPGPLKVFPSRPEADEPAPAQRPTRPLANPRPAPPPTRPGPVPPLAPPLAAPIAPPVNRPAPAPPPPAPSPPRPARPHEVYPPRPEPVRAAAPAPAPERQREPDREAATGAWFSLALFLVVLIVSLALTVYTFVRPFLPGPLF